MHIKHIMFIKQKKYISNGSCMRYADQTDNIGISRKSYMQIKEIKQLL